MRINYAGYSNVKEMNFWVGLFMSSGCIPITFQPLHFAFNKQIQALLLNGWLQTYLNWINKKCLLQCNTAPISCRLKFYLDKYEHLCEFEI